MEKPENQKIVFGAFVVIALVFAHGWLTGDETKDENSEKKAGVSSEECRKDLQCWAKKNNVDATIQCKKQIEKLAKWSVKWNDGFLESTFSRIDWIDQKNGTLRYIGDKLELQNGFGAWQPHIYLCEFDPNHNAIIRVTAEPGRL